jgi:hypothetical protein
MNPFTTDTQKAERQKEIQQQKIKIHFFEPISIDTFLLEAFSVFSVPLW